MLASFPDFEIVFECTKKGTKGVIEKGKKSRIQTKKRGEGRGNRSARSSAFSPICYTSAHPSHACLPLKNLPPTPFVLQYKVKVLSSNLLRITIREETYS